MFTDDTNLATVPIKFAMPPYNFNECGTNYTFCDFERRPTAIISRRPTFMTRSAAGPCPPTW